MFPWRETRRFRGWMFLAQVSSPRHRPEIKRGILAGQTERKCRQRRQSERSLARTWLEGPAHMGA